MFNGFPVPIPDSGSGQPFLDWSAYQTVCDITGTNQSVPATSWGTFVDVAGRGFLKWCRMNGATNSVNPDIKITIDGKPYTFDTPNAGFGSQGNEINFMIPFKSSLKIEGYNRHSAAVNLSCDYLYLLQQSLPSHTKNTLFLQSQRKMIHGEVTATTLTDVANITGSGYLLGARFLGIYGTAVGTILADIAVDGAQKMTDRGVFTVSGQSVKLTEVIGPIRFETSLKIRARVGTAGASALCFVWYSLD